jgi:hypothetical protein
MKLWLRVLALQLAAGFAAWRARRALRRFIRIKGNAEHGRRAVALLRRAQDLAARAQNIIGAGVVLLGLLLAASATAATVARL